MEDKKNKLGSKQKDKQAQHTGIALEKRLNIVKGQVEALGSLIDKGEDCQKVISQFYAANKALKKAIEIYLKENISECVNSLDTEEKKRLNHLLKEMMKNK